MCAPNCAPSRDKSKSPSHALAGRLMAEAGLNLAQVRVALDAVADHIVDYYGETRQPGAIVHTAVSASEPAGKPIWTCKVVPVQLTSVQPTDVEILREKGSVELRMIRLYRFCREAQQQGGLLSQEDLALLLGVHTSTVSDLVRNWRDRGVVVPTRGAVKDIGPEPSHKRIIADLLGRGFSTSQICSMTSHTEGPVGRYQQQFGLVVHLMHAYPDASDDERCQLSGLTVKAYDVYVEVYRKLVKLPECELHLERLRRRYEADPDGLAHKPPPGKAQKDQTSRRLEQQTLHTTVRQTIAEDLGTTPRVAQAVADDITALIDDSFRLSDSLRPGEITVFVDAHDAAFISGQRVADRKVIPVTLPLYTDETLQLWRSDEPAGRRRARIAVKLALAAHEQGGIMSVAKLAELLHVRDSTLGSSLRQLAVACHIEAPTKGLIEDAGATLTHKDWIVGLDHYGLTGEEISYLTRHAPNSRDRYLQAYHRAETLMRLEGRIPEPKDVARLLRLRLHVARQYVDLLRRYHGDGDCSPDSAGTTDHHLASEAC